MSLRQRIEIKEVERQIKALDSIDTRELASLARDEQRDRYVLARGPEGVMPSLTELIRRGTALDSSAPDVQAEFEGAARDKKSQLPDIEGDFERASRGDDRQPRTTGEGSLLGQSGPPDHLSRRQDKSKSRDPDRDLS